MRCCAIILLLSFVNQAFAQQWVNVLQHANTNNAVAGQWSQQGGTLRTEAANGARILLPYAPSREYDFRVSFTRNSGVHSIALIFPCGNGQATFEPDAWGQHLAGIQMIDGQDLRANRSRAGSVTLTNGQRYTAVIEVRRSGVRALLDDRLIMEYQGDGSNLSVPAVWRVSQSTALGLGAYQSDTTFHSAEVRNIGGAGRMIASAGASTGRSPSPSATTVPATSSTSPAPTPSTPRGGSGKGASVLLVIANHHFFYREYADPKQELERAGHRVTVAAGQRQSCYPHNNSGQRGDGRVMPDIAISQAKASDYDAIVFSGGWGSSMYQFAFEGRYNTPQYNGQRAIKSQVNQLIGDFVQQGKFVGGICHGVSVLAWSRINGQSLLRGRRVTAPTINGPAGIYNGSRAQPQSRWNAQQNGANLVPPRSIGNPSDPSDDVMVDGKILTAEDDRAARHFGVVLAKLLNL